MFEAGLLGTVFTQNIDSGCSIPTYPASNLFWQLRLRIRHKEMFYVVRGMGFSSV
jgi:hypothetical protein